MLVAGQIVFFVYIQRKIHAMRRTVLALAALCCIGTVHAFAPAPLVLKSSSQSRSSGRTGGLTMQLHTPVERRSLFFKTASLVVLFPSIISPWASPFNYRNNERRIILCRPASLVDATRQYKLSVV